MRGTSPSRGARNEAECGNKVPRWEVRTLINSRRKGKSTAILYVGIDLAKNVFAVHGVNEAGKPELVRPAVPRARLHELIAGLAPCTIGMEACTGAHHRARLFSQHGQSVRLIAPKFVVPYRLSGKRGQNDAADAEPLTGRPEDGSCLAKGRASVPGAPCKGPPSAKPCSAPTCASRTSRRPRASSRRLDAGPVHPCSSS